MDRSMTSGQSWTRYALLTGGGLLALQGLRRGGWAGVAMTALGAGLLARGVADEEVIERLKIPELRDRLSGPVRLYHSITIRKPRGELYQFWRDFRNLSRIMPDVVSIDVSDARHSHWVVRAPGGVVVQWDAEVHGDQPNERIAWATVGNPDIRNCGEVEFSDAPDGRGTEVRLTLDYEAPMGRLGRGIAKLTGHEPQIQAERALRRLKQLLEAGEFSTVEGQPSGRM